MPPLETAKSKYDDAKWAEHVKRRAACCAVFFNEAIDIVDPTPYFLKDKTKNDVTLWHKRIWEHLESKFPLPIATTEVTYGKGILNGDSNDADEEPPTEEAE